jgi:iron complex transport system ATP-binding protein
MLNEQDTLPPEMALAESLAAPSLRSAAEQAPAAGELPAPWLQLDQAVLQLGPQRFGPYRLALSPGERVAVLGPSGAGKSTLLKLLSGELHPRQGSVKLQGRPLARLSRAELSRQRAVLPQHHGVAFGLPVSLVVGLGRAAREPDPAMPQIVQDALRLARAAHLQEQRFDHLSGGEQARVQLARVLAQLWDSTRGLLLVDEPLSALDPGLQFELMDALQGFARERGHALVAVLHDLNQALNGFDRLWLVAPREPVQDLAAGLEALPALETLYGVRLRGVRDADGSLAVLMRRREAAAPATFGRP